MQNYAATLSTNTLTVEILEERQLEKEAAAEAQWERKSHNLSNCQLVRTMRNAARDVTALNVSQDHLLQEGVHSQTATTRPASPQWHPLPKPARFPSPNPIVGVQSQDMYGVERGERRPGEEGTAFTALLASTGASTPLILPRDCSDSRLHEDSSCGQ
jgi:hypothetical protein